MSTLAALLLAGCAGGEVKVGEGGLQILLPTGAVIDPKLEGDPALSLEVSAEGAAEGCAGELWVENAVGQRRALALEPGEAVAWDGLDDEGLAFDPGAARALATCGEAAALADLHVVRLGVTAVDFRAGPEDGQVALAWHKRTLLDRELSPIDPEIPEYLGFVDDGWALADLDLDDGSPRPAVEPWPDAALPPWGEAEQGAVAQNAPAAYVAGTRPAITVTAGARTVSARAGVALEALPAEGPALRLVLDGWSEEGAEAIWSAEAEIALVADEPLAETLGRYPTTLSWRWQASSDEGWVDVPGQQRTTHDLWQLAGPTALRDGVELGFAPALTWVGVLAELEEDLQGLPAEPEVVLDQVRDHLNQDRWLIYNPSDSAYSSYSGPYIYWDYIWSDLGIWLDRAEGIELYCHSLSCLLSVLSGHWGVYAPQQVLGVGFNTNYTLAAGTTSWQTWSFNSHSVVSPDEGATLWDASIDLDGDGDPGSAPSEALAPKGLSQEEYLGLLTEDEIGIVNSGLCYFQ